MKHETKESFRVLSGNLAALEVIIPSISIGKSRNKGVTCNFPFIIANITGSGRRSRTVITNRLLNTQ
jgi:hypothetical protein